MTATLTKETFDSLKAQVLNRIPVSLFIIADTETPLSAYNKLARAEGRFCSNRFRVVSGRVVVPSWDWLAQSEERRLTRSEQRVAPCRCTGKGSLSISPKLP